MSRPARDRLAPWFAALELLGEDIHIRLGAIEVGAADAAPHWRAVRHTERDGVGAITEALGAATTPNLPVLRHPEPPGVWSRIRAVWEAIRAPKPTARAFAAPLGPDVGPCSAVAWRVLTPDQTTAVDRAAQSAGVSTNSWLVARWHAAIEFEFEATEHPALYHVPVNMRRTGAEGLHNHAVNLVIPVFRGDAAGTVHARIRDQLAQNRHWALWDLTRVLGRLGPERLHRAMQRDAAKTPYAGASVITNFGKWDDADGRAWVALAPIARAVPSSVALLTVNHRLGIGVQIHPALDRDPARAQRWLDRYVDRLLQP